MACDKQTTKTSLYIIKQGLLALLVLLGAASTYGAELNVSNDQLPINVALYLDHIEDVSGALTISEILITPQQWSRSTQSVPTLGFSSSAHWYYLELTGDQIAGTELALSIDSPTIDRIEFYQVQDNEIVSAHIAGDTIPLTGQVTAYRIPVFPLLIKNSNANTAIYLRVTSQSGIELPITLSTMQFLLEGQQTEVAFFGALFIFFFLSFVLCSIVYYYFRDKQFLGYTLFFGSSLFFFLSVTGMGRVWFWGESIEINSRIVYLSGALLIISLCLLGQSLNVNNKFRDSIIIVLRFISYAMIPTCLYFVALPFEYISGSNIQTLLSIGLLVAIVVLSLSVMAASQGSRVAIYLICTWTLLILAYLSMLGYKFNIIEKSAISALVGETLAGFGALALFLSLTEFTKIKNEEFSLIRLEAKAKSDFLRNVSKEFLTPVHLILANSKRLMSKPSAELDSTSQQQVTTVIKQSEHLHNLINDLLEMAEIESDSFEAEFELVEITRFLADIRDMMLPAALEKMLEFDTQFTSPSLLVQTDKARLQHVLINLITNAIRFTEKGSITLGFQAIYFQRKLGIEISVKDTGSGMSPEFKSTLFDEFSHNEDFSELSPTNTGLGMVIVKRVIEKLGGEISFDSKVDAGSEFFVRLPLRVHKP